MEILETLQDGSDRVFHRVRWGNTTAILMQETDPVSFQKYLQVARLLSPHSPRIYHFDPQKLTILMEDLGDLSLYRWMQSGQDPQIYFRVIHLLREIQELPCEALPVFSRDSLIAEIDYFLTWNPHMTHLKDILMDNALFLSTLPERTFMHRDFQSRNIFIKGGRIRLIDFQSAHCGHPYYDLASLLWDPYVELSEEYREKLAHHYGADMELLKRFAIQRLAQATAAYRKLSRRKPFFERFIPVSTNRLIRLIEDLNLK